ncbi:anthrax toxin lethal factor-related metalloendopeptidase [Paenibacillus sp. 1P07SE]|uniref:anthrax toxin lethal factor-related metalloendopeptidase n=1 Tax=Paenibacillus sp. 1P07SE TaxID=3132209 RepID=UPI0039A75F6C
MNRLIWGAVLRRCVICITLASTAFAGFVEVRDVNSSVAEAAIHNGSLKQRLFALPAGAYDAALADQMTERVLRIPPAMLELLVERGVQIRLISGLLTDEPEMQGLRGHTPRGWERSGLTWDDIPGVGGKPVIVRIGFSHSGMGHSSANLELHETFHAIDTHVLGGISSSRPFMALFRAEAHLLFGGKHYEERYPEEYFAEASTLMFVSPESRALVAAKAPKTYRYLNLLYRGYAYLSKLS